MCIGAVNCRGYNIWVDCPINRCPEYCFTNFVYSLLSIPFLEYTCCTFVNQLPEILIQYGEILSEWGGSKSTSGPLNMGVAFLMLRDDYYF